MKSGLVISGSAHSLLLIVILTKGIFLLSDNPNLSAKNMDVYIISEAEFDAEISIPPTINTDHKVDDQKLDSPIVNSLEVRSDNKIDEIEQHKVDKGLESKAMDTKSLNLLMVEPSTKDKKQNKLEPDLSLVNNDIKKLEEKTIPNSSALGNEVKSSQTPSLSVPVARNEDRIDRIASDNKSADSISDANTPDTTDSIDEVLDKNTDTLTASENKAATTEITPDGVKDAPIVVSGALENAVIPPSREIVRSDEENQSDEKENEQLHIDKLVAALNEDQVASQTPKSIEISTMEKIKLRRNINQLIGRYWNKGILIGGSDFENLVIRIEILLDSQGNIIGDVRPIKPAAPSGRYLIAFREASNAIKAVGKIPIPSEKYTNGLRLKLTFDPASGIGFD